MMSMTHEDIWWPLPAALDTGTGQKAQQHCQGHCQSEQLVAATEGSSAARASTQPAGALAAAGPDVALLQ